MKLYGRWQGTDRNRGCYIGLGDPANCHAAYHAMDLNFRRKPTRKGIDAGVVIPTVNNGAMGCAPDLGALEVGRPEPKWLKK